MLTVPLKPQAPTNTTPDTPKENKVLLADGSWLAIDNLRPTELVELQWDQEQRFSRAIAAMPKNSRERALVTGQAYNTICTILSALRADDEPLVMGLDKRYMRLVLDLLSRQVSQGNGRPRFFEIGFGSGMLLKEVADYGYPVAGVEISTSMHQQAVELLGERRSEHLFCRDLRELEVSDIVERPSLVYWNDVFEHICPDEIGDYLAHIYQLLQPRGTLVTITPNWLLRPSDVTRVFCPLRTEARGLHFKEYRLAEVTRLLKQTGFRRVATPLVVSKRHVYLCGSGFRLLKQWCEPLIDHLSIKPAHLLCRGLGLSYTIATK